MTVIQHGIARHGRPGGTTQHGLVKVALSSGSLITSFNAHLRADTGVGQYGAYDGEAIIAMAPGPNSG